MARRQAIAEFMNEFMKRLDAWSEDESVPLSEH